MRPVLAALLLSAVPLSGCATAYYSALENFGIEKREVLIDRVMDGRKAQAQAQQTFKNALEQYRATVSFDGGDLEDKYDTLSRSFERMEDDADDVRERIESIEDVGRALFREWEQELDEYSDPSLRRNSEAQLRETRSRFDQVVAAMERAAGRMDPVLDIYRDRVLYLKHNLNAQAIAALDAETLEIETRVDRLIAEMDRAIAEADRFIAQMEAATG